MARTVTEIKKTMTDAFMADATIREKYGLSGDETFNTAFSVVSLESILFFIVAACCHVLETLFDKFRADMDEKVSTAVVASVPWYYRIARQFQYGDELVFDGLTQQYGYKVPDERKRVVRYVAVRDRGTSVEILAGREVGGRPAPLPDNVLTAFKCYLNAVKIAGVIINVKSLPADTVRINATVYVNPLIFDGAGGKIADGSFPVAKAIEGYLAGIVYGGTFNKTKLVDAIQSVQGVVDVELGECQCQASGSTGYMTIMGNNYTSRGGSFIATGLDKTLKYELQY